LCALEADQSYASLHCPCKLLQSILPDQCIGRSVMSRSAAGVSTLLAMLTCTASAAMSLASADLSPGVAAYAGPCPPKGTGVHHYEFTIWALPTLKISLADDEKASALNALPSKHAIDRASLIGLVSAPPN
jgi:phosphatidylethanolamine-binding protein (PEBP) family uncharacterized protein